MCVYMHLRGILICDRVDHGICVGATVTSIQLFVIESHILHLFMAVQRSENWIVQLSDRIVV